MAHPLVTKTISSARVKNDSIDAKTLAHLLRTNLLPEARLAPPAREARRLVRMRSGLVRIRSRLKNQVHAVLAEHGVEVELTDFFGRSGRNLLSELRLPATSQQRVEACLRLMDQVSVEAEDSVDSDLVAGRKDGGTPDCNAPVRAETRSHPRSHNRQKGGPSMVCIGNDLHRKRSQVAALKEQGELLSQSEGTDAASGPARSPRLRAADQQLKTLFAHDPRVERLLPIPGVGITIAATIVAEVWDISRFDSPDRLCSWTV